MLLEKATAAVLSCRTDVITVSLQKLSEKPVNKLRERYSKRKSDSDPDMVLSGYFQKASYVRFDLKLLKGFLQNISGFSTDEISNAVATNACFLAVCTGNRYTDLINRIYGSEEGSDDLAAIALMAIKEHKKSFLRLMEEQLGLFLKTAS